MRKWSKFSVISQGQYKHSVGRF